MKNFIRLILGGYLLLFVVFTTAAQNKASETVAVCFKSNMDCKDCELTLTNYLKFEKGVKDLNVDFESNTIKVIYKAGKNTPENIAKGIKKKGYEANSITEKEYEKLIGDVPKK
jgi:copper chaperone CopZ